MQGLNTKALQKVLSAAEILHSRGHGSFQDRLFRAVDVLLPDSYYAFEVVGTHDASNVVLWDAPVSERDLTSLLARSCEPVPVEHPIFPRMLGGDFATIRLSDLVSQRKLRQTALCNDVFKPTAGEYQIVMPFVSGEYICGVTANRSGKDYSDGELEMARVFSRHLVAAYSTEQILSAAQARRAQATDHTALRRRGLTPRECEVLSWAAEGKRNAEIAIILGIATVTVEVHLTAAYRKLGVENRMAAVRVLWENG